MPWNNRKNLNNNLLAWRVHTSNPACWLSLLVLTFQGDKCFYNISNIQDEGRGGCFSSRVYCCLSSMIFAWWLWWVRSTLLLDWGLHWLISVGILGKPLGKSCNAENSGIESLHPDGKWLKELFAFAAAVVLTPLLQGSQSLVLLLLVCSEARRAIRKTLLPTQLSLYSWILLTKFYIRAKQCL